MNDMTVEANGYTLPNSNQPTVYFNLDLLFNDPTIDQWNILPQRDQPIDDKDWAIVQTRLAHIFDSIYKDRDDERERLFRFLEQCMGTADAQKTAANKLLENASMLSLLS